MVKWKFGDEIINRDRGVLTESDREYLQNGGENLATDASRRNKEVRLRQRLWDSVIDFVILIELLEDDVLAKVFEKETETWEDVAFETGLKCMIELIYRGFDVSDHDLDFATVLESAVIDAEVRKHGRPVEVDVDFGFDVSKGFDQRGALARYQAGDPLTLEDLGGLLAHGGIVHDEDVLALAEAAREHATERVTVSPMLAHQQRRDLNIPADADINDLDIPVGALSPSEIETRAEANSRAGVMPLGRQMSEQRDGENETGDDGNDESDAESE